MSEHTPADGWTVDDLDRFPDDNIRRELLDGVLLVSPSPSRTHMKIAFSLAAALDASCPPDYDVNQEIDVQFGDHRCFAPDVLVVTAAAAERTERPFMSHEVVLAVEIVSPTSRAMDRITKPAIYAAADIPFYWRIETDDKIVVHAHELNPVARIYQPTASFTDVIELAEPWPIEIPLSRITPRSFKRG